MSAKECQGKIAVCQGVEMPSTDIFALNLILFGRRMGYNSYEASMGYGHFNTGHSTQEKTIKLVPTTFLATNVLLSITLSVNIRMVRLDTNTGGHTK